MEQCNNCASCKNLTALVQKFQTKFTLYKQKNLQNDENLNTFKRQNKLLASLQKELHEKNVSLAECQRKLKSLQVDCSALRLTLEKEKEDNEKRLTTKFKDSDEELLKLRNELETTKTKLLAQQINNNQLVLKLDQEAKVKADLEKSFAKEKKELQEKVANAENLTATFKRSLTLWSGLKNNRPELIRVVLRYVNKWERRSEAARLEANLLNNADSVELDLEDGSLDNESDASAITSPKKNKREGSFSATDSSDDDFEEVAKSKSPVKLLPADSSRRTGTDHLFTYELGSDEIDHTAVSPSELNSGSNSRNVSRKSTSPRKDSPRKAISGKKSEIVKEMKNVHVQTEAEVRHTGCDPVESDVGGEVRTNDRVLASLRDDFNLHCGRLSPFGDNFLLGSESTSNPFVLVSSQSPRSALCHVCDSLLSKCTPCQSVFQEFSEFKRSKETLTNGCESPPRETSEDQEEGRSLFSPVRHRERDSCDPCVLEPPSLEEDLSLNFGDTPAQFVKVDVSLQTNSRRTHVKTQTVNIPSRTVGCQSEVVYTSDKAARRVVDAESRTTQTELLPAEEKVKCTLCDKTDSAVCPMKEFLKTSLTNTIQQSKFVSSVAMRDFVETSLANLIRQSDFISNCSGVFSGYPSLESVSIPSFYVQHPGMFAPSPAVPFYGPFNPTWCYTPDVPVRGQNCLIPMFKKEERSRPNERSDEAESRKRRNRSRSRSSLRKSDVETSSRRASRKHPSDSKRTDSSDSSFEETEDGEDRKKRKLRGRGSSQDVVNPKKKVKEDLRSKRQLSSESSCEDSESQEKRNTQLSDLSLGGKCGKPERKTLSPTHPKMDGSAKDDVPLKKMRSTEERSVVGELPTRSSLVENRSNVRTVELPSNWEENPAPSANDPPLLLPAVMKQSSDSLQVKRDEEESLPTVPPNDPPVLLPATEKKKDSFAVPTNDPPRLIPAVTKEKKDSSQVTAKQHKPQFTVPANSPPVLLPVVKEKSQDSLTKTNTLDEPYFAVPTRRPPRANIKKDKQFEKNLRSAKSAIAFVSGGYGRSLSDTVTESESVDSTGSDTSFVDVGVDRLATVRKEDVRVSDLPTWELKRYNTRPVVTSAPVCSEDESRVSTLKSTAGENASITQDVKSLSPKKGNTPSSELKSLRKTGTFEGPSFCPELRVIGNDQKVRSPVKSPVISPSLHSRKALAILEDDLRLSEDSDSDVEISPDKVTEVCHDNVEEMSYEEEGDQSSGEREAAVEVSVSEDSVGTQGRNREVDSHEDSQAKENAFDFCEKEEMDLRFIGAETETHKEVESVGTLLQKEDLEKEQEGVSVEACNEVEAKSQEGDWPYSVAEEQEDNSSAMEIALQSEVVEGSNELSARVDEEVSSKVQEESENISVLHEGGDLNQFDAAVISALVEVFPDDKVSVEDLGNPSAVALSSIFDVSDSEEANDFGVTTQPLTQDGNGENVQFTEAAETMDSDGESGTNSVKLFDDLEDSGRYPCDVDEDMMKSEVKEVKGAIDSSEISGSVFGSLFEDLSESDPNLSGVGDLVASVLPDFSAVDSPQMVIDAEEPHEGEMAVPGQISPVKESTVIPNGNDTACAKRDDNDTVICEGVRSDECLPPLEIATDNRNSSGTTKEVPTAPKRHIAVVVAPIGPYLTRRASGALSNHKNPSASATSIQRTEETLSDDTQISGRKLRSRTGAKSVVDKKRKFASRQLISSDSSSESDSEKLVIAEEGQRSGRMSPKDSPPEKSKDSIKVEISESSPIGTRTRMKTRSSPPLLPVKKHWYSTRASTGSRTSESDANSEVSAEGIRLESVLGSDESSMSSPPPNVSPKSRQSGRIVNLEPTRRSSRQRTKPRRWSESDECSPEKEDESPSDAEKEVFSVASKTTAPVIPKRASKLEKLRTNLSKGHPLLQQIAHRSDAPPVKRIKVGAEDESESADGKPKFGTSALMPKSGRTICLLPSDPKNVRKRQGLKDPSNPTVQSGNSTTVFTKPRITPQERLAVLQPSASAVETNSKDVIPQETTPNNLSPRSTPPTPHTSPKSVPTTPKIAPANKTVSPAPVQALTPTSLKETSLQSNQMNSPKETLQLTPTSSEVNAPIFKRSNSIRNYAANRPAILLPPVKSPLRLVSAVTPIPRISSNDLNVEKAVAIQSPPFSTSAARPREEIASSRAQAKPEVPEFTSVDLSSAVPAVSELGTAPVGQLSSDGAASGRAKRSNIWVQPAMEIEKPTTVCRLEMDTPKEKELIHFRPVSKEQSVVRGLDLIAIINSTSPGDLLSTDLVMDDRHPLLVAWKRRGSTVRNVREQQEDLERGMAESVPAIRKLLNAYWSSSYFTEELLTHTVNSLLNPKYICMDIIVSRLIVEMVEIDFDSEPCIGSPGPGQFLTTLQQKMVALVMRLFPTYRNIVRDVLLLIEFYTYRLNKAPDSGRLPWLAVLHTSLCRIMKWRDLSLIFCYDAMYCFVTRYATVLNCVFQVWPELLPSVFDKSKNGSIFQVMTHFIMTQGEPDKNSDLKALRSLLLSKRAYSGDTNSSALTQCIVQNIKDGECGPISPALILISKREDIPWSQDKIVNEHLLPMIRDWLLSDDHANRPLPPAAVLTLCGIVRAFRGTESSVSATHTLMKTLLLDTKAVSASPDLEVAAFAGWVFLARHNIEFVVHVLKKWQPRNRSPEWLIELLTNVMSSRARPPHWWAKEIGNLLVSSEPFPQISEVCI